MNIPAYGVGEVVYLRESAALGILEAVRISEVRSRSGNWIYSIQARASQPVASSTYGDRISQVTGQVLYFDESELITQCAALDIMEATVLSNLMKIQEMKQSLCDNTNG